jgi:uncharacterized heparinase superfamily protein
LATENAVALLDVAPIGPDYLPSHANADTLSFELSLFGQRVIVNGGTSRYGSSPDRLRQRQTAAHSTLEIDGQSSSEVWGGFRVAKRGYPFALDTEAKNDQVYVACSHTGYTHLPGRPVHRRTWVLKKDSLMVSDEIEGGFRSAVARYIFHPTLSIEASGVNSFAMRLNSQKTITISVNGGKASLEDSQCAFEFGKTYKTMCLNVHPQDRTMVVLFSWLNE